MYWLAWFKSLHKGQLPGRSELRQCCIILLQGVGDERQDLLVLVQQQHGAQVAETLVSETRGGQQLQTFNLAEMCPLAEGEEVEQLRDVVPPACVSTCAPRAARLHPTHLTLESWLSSLKLARMAALSFCTTARSSAIVFAARTFRMNCLTAEA